MSRVDEVGEPGGDLPRDARLQAALRHAEDAALRPSPAVRAQVLAAAREAVRPVAVPQAGWRQWWQALGKALGKAAWAPRGQAGLATLAVAGIAAGLWAGREVPPPWSAPAPAAPTAPARPSQAPPPAEGADAVAAASVPATESTVARPAAPAAEAFKVLQKAAAPAAAPPAPVAAAQAVPAEVPPPALMQAPAAAPAPAPEPERALAVGRARAEPAPSDLAMPQPAASLPSARMAETSAVAMARGDAAQAVPPGLLQALAQPGWRVRTAPGVTLEPLDDARRERLRSWLQVPGVQPEGPAPAPMALDVGLDLQGPQGERVWLQRVDGQTLQLRWQGRWWRLRQPGAAEATGLGGP